MIGKFVSENKREEERKQKWGKEGASCLYAPVTIMDRFFVHNGINETVCFINSIIDKNFISN